MRQLSYRVRITEGCQSKFSDAVKAHTPKERAHIAPKTIITSRTKLLELGHHTKPLIIGERINPTGRKVLAQELRDGSFIRVMRWIK